MVDHLSGTNKTMLYRAGAPKHNFISKVICFKWKCRAVIGWRKTQQRNKFKKYKKGPAIPRLKYLQYLKEDSIRAVEQVSPPIVDTVQQVTSKPIEKDSVISFVFNDVLFDTNSSHLKNEFTERLDTLSEHLYKYKSYRIRIVGHTDNSGTEKENVRLSQSRAEAVATYLVSTGIDRDLITAEGMGSKSPIAENNTVEGRQKNRRVEIFLTFH